MIGLPDSFLHMKNGRGGGVIQTTASEATLGSQFRLFFYCNLKFIDELFY